MAIICTNCRLTNIPSPPPLHPVTLPLTLCFPSAFFLPLKGSKKGEGRSNLNGKVTARTGGQGTKGQRTKEQWTKGQRTKGQRGTKQAEKHSTESKKGALERQNTKFSTKKIKKSAKNLELSDISFIFAPAIQTELPHGGCSSVG